ncbi:hypothetical protein LBMAG33_4210 [Candidatus Levyibacteriota bacterium]|nr:hypothetical protein LBMAG33_4210 [Candidatus Levybacteria bacterium]
MGEGENYGQSNNADKAARETIDLATGRGDWTILKKEVPKPIQEETPKVIQEETPKIIQEETPKVIQEETPKIIQEETPKISVSEKIDQLIIELGNEPTEIEDISDDELSSKIKLLEGLDDLQILEYKFIDIKKYKKQIDIKLEKLKNQKEIEQSKDKKIAEKLEEINKLNFIKKVFEHFNKKKLEEERYFIGDKLKENNDEQMKLWLIYKLRNNFEEKLYIKKVENVIEELENDYRKKLEKLENNEEFKEAEQSTKKIINDLINNDIKQKSENLIDKIPFELIKKIEIEERIFGYITDYKGWIKLKESKAANEIFGDLIQNEDSKIYGDVLEKSLTDFSGEYIDLLSYYPTPDTIRNVLILATADSSIPRTIHANWVLSSLARRDNWGEILDQAQQVYPALRSARLVLEDWKYDGINNNPQAQEAVKDFALSLIEGDQDIGRLKGLATEALSNHSLLEVLNKKGVVSEAELRALGEAESFIKRISEERWQKTRNNQEIRIGENVDTKDKDIPYIDSYSLKKAIRQNLFNLMYSRQGEDQEQLGSMKRLVTLSQRILDNQTNYSSLGYLASDEVVEVIANKQIKPELILAFPKLAKLLMDEKMKETRAFIFEHGETILKDESDLKFLNKIVGEFGQKSDPLIRGYQECLDAGVITHADRELVLEFARQFRVISPTTLGGYKEAKEAGHKEFYISQLTALAEKMTGSGVITDEERAKPVYKDLLKHVYSNNSGQWSSFESNESCDDRRSDIAEFNIRPWYEIDLLSQSEIRVKDGKALDPRVQEEVQKPIFAVSERMSELGYDYEKIKSELKIAIDGSLEQIIENGGLKGLDLNSVTSPEERLFLVLTDSIYGTKALDKAAVKNLLITYEFANFDDISDYIAGTRDRVGRASNQDYALLCETGEFYSNRIKEVNRRLVEAAWNNPAIAELMPEYFKKLAQETITSERKDKINQRQVDRLGLSDSFVKQVGEVLEKRKKGKIEELINYYRKELEELKNNEEFKEAEKIEKIINDLINNDIITKYEPDKVRKIIRRYEGITGGLSEKASTSKNLQTKAFYGQLRSQREKTFEALGVITGENVDPSKVHLGEVNLQQVLDVEANIREGKYDGDQFASYTVQRFIDLFDEERTKIEGELDKFESLSGKQREVLYASITKAKESAHARMVGGVCVAGDNPDKYADQNMWNMPNYFQLVFQEPDTLQCQGLVLLHHFTQGGKKVLTASVNPSSTYLYSVDESALFTGIMGTLEQFANENGFDLITLSKNNGIRTNRTSGQFEKAMNERITQVGKTFRFDTPQQFSYHPNYQLQDMDVVWERK